MSDRRPSEKTALSRLSRFRRAAFLCFWAAFIILCVVYRKEITVERLLNDTPDQPFLAALVLLAMFAVKGLSLVLYGGILFAAGGLLFPLPAALLLNTLGSAIMLSLPFFIGRRLGSGILEELVKKNPKAESLQNWSRRNDRFLMLLIRLVGFLPADLVSMYFGALGAPYGRYLFWSVLGMLPSAATFTVMGGHIKDPLSPAFLISAACKLSLMLLSLLVTVYRKKHTS